MGVKGAEKGLEGDVKFLLLMGRRERGRRGSGNKNGGEGEGGGGQVWVEK